MIISDNNKDKLTRIKMMITVVVMMIMMMTMMMMMKIVLACIVLFTLHSHLL